MGRELVLTSPMPPSVNHYLSYRAVVSKSGKPLGMSYTTAEAKRYRKNFAEYVLSEVENQGWDLEVNTKQHFYVDGWFYFSRVDVDANNYWKILLDAITDTQSIWADDNVACERVQRIQYDSTDPRIELRITPVDYIGIFDSSDQMDEFIQSNCIGCSRYTRNCSVLKKAVDGRVQDGVTNCKCNFRKSAKAASNK